MTAAKDLCAQSRRFPGRSRRKAASFFCAACLASLMPAAAFSRIDPAGKTASDLIYEKEALTGEQPFSLKAGLEYTGGFIISADRAARLSASGSYRLSESLSLSLAQSLNQHYIRNPNSNDTGLWIQDTLLSLQKKFKLPSRENNLTAGLSASLPLSYYSRANDIYSLGTAYLTWSVKLDSFLGFLPKEMKNIAFSLKPAARMYFSKYTTSPTIGQSAGGAPLPLFLFGVQAASLSMDITDYFSLSGSYGQWAVSVQNISPDAAGDPNYKKRLRHFYILSLAGIFKPGKKWELALSYSHGERLDQQGRIEAVAFDKWVSVWAVSLSRAFSFDFRKAPAAAGGMIQKEEAKKAPAPQPASRKEGKSGSE